MNPLLRHLIEELSNKSNLAINDLLSEKCIVLFGLKYKELILWAKEFEFRTSSNDSNVIYLGSYVDKERNEMDLGFMNYMDGKPLAYFSIGTVLDDKSLSEFVGRLISAFGLVPEFNFIVSTGRLFDEIKTLMVPENVQIHRYVPQLQVLEKTSLMITMGGANSIKECIELGVPMLCYPFHNDQFGNSARVEFHKLGLRGDFQDPPQEMARKIKDIINNNEYETNILSFRKKAKTRITPSELKELIESLIEK